MSASFTAEGETWGSLVRLARHHIRHEKLLLHIAGVFGWRWRTAMHADDGDRTGQTGGGGGVYQATKC